MKDLAGQERPANFTGGAMKVFTIGTVIFFLIVMNVCSDELGFTELYKQGVLGVTLSKKVQSLVGKNVDMTGFMAPPLRASGKFFVLTKSPVSLCPFCNSDADWPIDIIVVYLTNTQIFSQQNRPLIVSGRLESGSYTDPETGFVSQLRLIDASWHIK